MARSLLDDILSCPTLPSLPAVAAEILELTSDPDVPMKKIAQAVQRDQALSGKVLKTVNSSFYGLSTPCGSIERAMAFLGLNTVKSLVLGFSLIDVTAVAGAEGFDLMTHWRRAIIGAVSARQTAVLTRAADPDEAFTAGLFQDIGVLACFIHLKADYAAAVADHHHRDWPAIEQRTFGFTHPTVGARLAEKWKLPEGIRTAIGRHHAPDTAESAHAELVRVVALGSMVASVLAREAPVPTAKQIASRSKAWFGDRAPDCDELLARAADDARVMAKLFAQDIGHIPDPQTLLAQAQEKSLEHQVQLQRRADDLARDASTDPLTGLANRRSFDHTLERAFEAFRAKGEPVAVIFCDADHFKLVNDTHGHAAGDAVLIELASRLRAVVGDAGLVSRYGGEEIAAVLPGKGIDAAAVLAEHMRHAVDAGTFSLSGVDCEPDELPVTISVGVCATDADTPDRYDTISRLVGDADACVYEAKRAGRNRVFVHRAAESTSRPAEQADTPAAPAAVRVLFVEDDPLAATLITTLLKRQSGVEIHWIESGTRAATEIAGMNAGETQPADVFLVDLNLPGTSGYELLRLVRASETLKGKTFIVLSGEDEATARAECLRLGATGFIPKQEFVTDIGRWLGMITGRAAKAA